MSCIVGVEEWRFYGGGGHCGDGGHFEGRVGGTVYRLVRVGVTTKAS